jgi:Ser/Thr protein kinase RdoA (MazF antagonist)
MLTTAQAIELISIWSVGDIVSIESFYTEDYHCSGNTVFVQTPNGKYVLKRTKIEEWTEWRYLMLAILHAHGVPVAVPISTCTGEHYLRQGDAVYTLSPYLPGIAVSDHFAGSAEERARQYGIALAQLHLGLKECESITKPTEMDLIQDVTWAKNMIAETDCNDQIKNITVMLKEITTDLRPTLESLPAQLIHRDAHAANLLYLDNKVTGWLDFDLSLHGPRLFDLCYCATSILMNGITDPEKRLRWISLLRSMVDGYTTVSPLNVLERAALFPMLLSIEAIFAGYYASQHNREQMDQNIHAMLWIYETQKRDLMHQILRM